MLKNRLPTVNLHHVVISLTWQLTGTLWNISIGKSRRATQKHTTSYEIQSSNKALYFFTLSPLRKTTRLCSAAIRARLERVQSRVSAYYFTIRSLSALCSRSNLHFEKIHAIMKELYNSLARLEKKVQKPVRRMFVSWHTGKVSTQVA